MKKYTHLYTGKDGKSHFEEAEFSFETDAKGDLRTPNMKATALNVKISYPLPSYDWHPAPRRQFAITVEGQVDIIASGGETRRFSPGDILLVDDLTGEGHMSKVVGKQTTAIFVPVEMK